MLTRDGHILVQIDLASVFASVSADDETSENNNDGKKVFADEMHVRLRVAILSLLVCERPRLVRQ